MMSGGVLCNVCKVVNGRKKDRVCRGCGLNFHLTCVNLTKVQSDAIPRWLCAECRRVSVVVNVVTDLPEEGLDRYLTRCRSWPVLARVPKGAVICVAEALQRLLSQATEEKSSIAWGRLLSFCYFGLRRPGSDSKSVSLATRVKRQVSDFMGITGLPTFPDCASRARGKRVAADDLLKKRVSAKLSDGDVKGAVRLLSSGEEHAPIDGQTRALLAAKHPAAPTDLSMPLPPDDSFVAAVAGEEDVRKALASFGPGSAGGLNGLRPCHLKALTTRVVAEASLTGRLEQLGV